MMSITHLLTSSLATGLLLETTTPEILLIGGIAGLLPDVDISTSPMGRILIPISTFLEKRFPHRSVTHSLLASGVLAIISYGLSIKFNLNIDFVHAVNIGFTAGWFLDVFTKSGIEMFYPLPVRCICPGNREYRISTASTQEYFLLTIIGIVTIFVFNINSNGGIMTAFNRIIAAPSGVLELYNEKGANNRIIAEIDGVYSSDRSPVKDKFNIIDANSETFIVENDGKLYMTGKNDDSTIIAKRITATVGNRVKIVSENLSFLDDDIYPLLRFQNQDSYISGEVIVDDPELIIIPQHDKEYQPSILSGNIIKFNSTPANQVITILQNQILSGSLLIKSYVQ